MIKNTIITGQKSTDTTFFSPMANLEGWPFPGFNIEDIALPRFNHIYLDGMSNVDIDNVSILGGLVNAPNGNALSRPGNCNGIRILSPAPDNHGVENITIRNCNINDMQAVGDSESHGIYISDGKNMCIENNCINGIQYMDIVQLEKGPDGRNPFAGKTKLIVNQGGIGHGIHLENCHAVNIENNKIMGSSANGIHIDGYSSGLCVDNNKTKNNLKGFVVGSNGSISDSIFTKNTALLNVDDGFELLVGNAGIKVQYFNNHSQSNGTNYDINGVIGFSTYDISMGTQNGPNSLKPNTFA